MYSSYIPALVQVQEPWQKMYLGTCAGKGACVNLDMVHLKKVPPHCKYLTGAHPFPFRSNCIDVISKKKKGKKKKKRNLEIIPQNMTLRRFTRAVQAEDRRGLWD